MVVRQRGGLATQPGLISPASSVRSRPPPLPGPTGCGRGQADSGRRRARKCPRGFKSLPPGRVKLFRRGKWQQPIANTAAAPAKPPTAPHSTSNPAPAARTRTSERRGHATTSITSDASTAGCQHEGRHRPHRPPPLTLPPLHPAHPPRKPHHLHTPRMGPLARRHLLPHQKPGAQGRL